MDRIVRAAVVGAVLLVVAQYVAVAALTVGFPHQLEWMEGGMLDVVARLRAGEAVYVAPSVDYVPHVYPPLYFAVVAFASPFGASLWAGRLVSLLAVAGTGAVVHRLVARETNAWWWGLAGVGLFVATYELTGRWLHLARVDSLALFLSVAAIGALASFDGRRSALAGGLLFAAAFLTKQTAALAAVPVLLSLFFADGRRAFVAAAAFVLAAGGAVVGLAAATDGWFAYYTLSLPAQHDLAVSAALAHLGAHLVPLVPALVAAVTALVLLFRTDHPRRWLWLGTGAGLALASVAAYVRTGSHLNALMPLCLGTALLAPQCLARLGGATRSVAPLILVVQLALLTHPTSTSLPPEADRARADAFLSWLDAQPGEVLVPDFRFVQRRIGRSSHGLGMAARDVLRAERQDPARRMLERSLAHALEERRFSVIVLSQRDWLDSVVALAYEPAGTVDAPRPLTGWPFRPRWVWRRPDEPARPPNR